MALDSVNYVCFAPSRCQRFHCNAMRKAIKTHKDWRKNSVCAWYFFSCFYIEITYSNFTFCGAYTLQQNEHTPEK